MVVQDAIAREADVRRGGPPQLGDECEQHQHAADDGEVAEERRVGSARGDVAPPPAEDEPDQRKADPRPRRIVEEQRQGDEGVVRQPALERLVGDEEEQVADQRDAEQRRSAAGPLQQCRGRRHENDRQPDRLQHTARERRVVRRERAQVDAAEDDDVEQHASGVDRRSAPPVRPQTLGRHDVAGVAVQ